MSSIAPLAAALALLVIASGAAPAGAASTQLSTGLPFSDVSLTTTLPKISPNGRYAVYRQDAVTDGAIDLWSVRLDVPAIPVRLSAPLTPSSGQFMTFAISPDSSRVVYSVDQDIAGKLELYSVAIGGGPIHKLNPGQEDDRDVAGFAISPTGDYVVYTCDRQRWTKYELYSVPIDGPGALAERLNADFGFDDDVEGYQISADGERVVYRAGNTDSDEWDLYSVPTGGGEAVRISRNLLNGSGVPPYFTITPDSTRVLYLADPTADGAFQLYSVAISGGDSTQLSGALVPGGAVDESFLVAPNSARVVYRADQSTNDVFELWSVPVGGGTPVRLNGPLGSGEDVEPGFEISANGARVVYRSDEGSNDVIYVHSVALTGGAVVRLNPPPVAGGDVLGLAVSPDSTRVVYLADQSIDTVNELWSVPIAGGTAVKLNRALVAGGDVQVFRISPNSQWVVYGADQDTDSVDELLRAPIAGGTVENVSGTLVPGGDVVLKIVLSLAFTISPVNSYDVLYTADERFNDDFELFLSGEPEEEPVPDACTPDATTLCLQDDRFNVRVTWRDFQNRTGQGRATMLSNQSGDFWFFNAQSNELIVKIINGCASTGNYWVFWRALSNVEMDLVIRNTATLQTLTYHNPLGYNSNGHLDIDTIFRCDGSGPAAETIDTSADLPAPGAPQRIERTDPAQIGPCTPDGERSICLQNGRFRVQGTWSDFNGGTGFAHLIKKNEGSGYAWFFNGNNYEMLFKLVDACSFNGNTWVSIAGLTNVAATLTITDTWTGKIYSQQNAIGIDFPTNLDIETNLDYCGPAPD